MDVLAISETQMPFESQQASTPTRLEAETSQYGDNNKFQQALSAWRNINLSKLVRDLDASASEIIGQQKEALVERKDLAQKTKDFRKLEDSAKLGEIKGLLKAYQGFIDLLTNQGKTSSSSFLNLYTTLSDAPDPFPLLEASIESFVLQEDTVPELAAENIHLQKRVQKLTADLEETERRLESERTRRSELADVSDTRSKHIESTWTKLLEDKQRDWDEKEKALEEKVENQDRLLKELKAGYDVAQKLTSNDGTSSDTSNKAYAAELELVSSELERATSRLGELEARNEQLQLELTRAVSDTSGSNKQQAEDDPAFTRLQSANSSLLRKLEAAEFDRDSQKREWDDRNRQLDRQRVGLEDMVADLRMKLERRSDYDELRRELHVLRSIELETGEDEDTHTHLNGSATATKAESLEQLLLSRNKKLSSELTILRVSHQELQEQMERLQDEMSRTNAELESSQKLSKTLENDLLQMQEEAANVLPSSNMSVAGTYTSRYPNSSRRGRASPTSSIISGYESRSPLESLRAGEPVGGGSGILPMIQAQRDRFKHKNAQLEEELSKTYASVTSLRQEVASLQKDNLNLYEKTRYVSAYNRAPNTTSSSFSQAPRHSSIQIDDVSVQDKYRSQYEAKISPFAAFRGRESARAYKRMTLPERIIFSVTRMVLATRTSRNLFAAYCLALHVLIFFMLYWTGSTDVEKHATHLGEVAAVAAGDAGLRKPQGQDWQLDGLG